MGNIPSVSNVMSTKLLILDFNKEATVVYKMQEIIASYRNHSFNIVVRQIDNISDTTSLEFSVVDLIYKQEPSILFMVLNSHVVDKIKSTVRYVKTKFAKIPIVLVIDNCMPFDILDLVREGADDFVILPIKQNDLLTRLIQLIRVFEDQRKLKDSLNEKITLNHIIGKNYSFVSETEKIPVVAKTDSTVLIHGETGTGKELFARAIHYLSSRNNKPFIPVNCGAIPVNLFENEFFGHEKGAYTGADASYSGLINEANGGTLFLDEIDSLSLISQVKLLRFLQDTCYRKVGSTEIQKANVRIITSTNINMLDAVEQGLFRRDLYYRLNVLSIEIPPLRERIDDIPILTSRFLNRYKNKFNRNISDISPRALNKLMSYDWPGNVRELEYVIERAVVLTKDSKIDECDIKLTSRMDSEKQIPFKEAKQNVVKVFEVNYIKSLLYIYNGNITKAARAAGKNRRAFWQLMRKYKIEADTVIHP